MLASGSGVHHQVDRSLTEYCLYFQIKVPSLKARFRHSATAIPHTPTLVEVVLFGGVPEWPKDVKTDADLPPIGNTVVLRFGESTSCICHTSDTVDLATFESLYFRCSSLYISGVFNFH